LAPTTSLTLSKNSPTEDKAKWQSTPRSGFQLKGYEAQYRKITETTWTNLQLVDSSNDFSLATSQVFSGEKGIEYVVRARTWHEQIGGDSHEVPGPWAEKTIALGGHISGRVLDNRAEPFGGLIVQASPILSKTAGPQGNYSLVTGVGSFSLTVKGGGSWTTPQAVRAVVPDDETTLPLTITLRPADDIIQNGDFESSSLAPWSHTISQPTFITTNQRSGQQSLCLTGLISAMFRPTLSFWYQVQSGDGADLLTAEVLGTSDLTPTNRFTTTTVSNTWQHAWLDLNLTEVYSGSVGVRFILNKVGPTPATVCLDEISLGGARRTYQLYLPVVVK
jgi:hypothetical protein